MIKNLLKGPDMLNVLERVSRADITPLAAERKLCLNFRWKKTCSACADVCPASAIDVEKLEFDAARCVGCGACAAVCPAGALTFQARSRISIISDIDEVLGKSETVIFCCDRCGGAFGKAKIARGSIVVPCLSVLDEALILGCYARGAKDVKPTGCTPECRFHQGRKIYMRTLGLSDELREALRPGPGAGRAGRKAKATEGKPVSATSDRREFILGSGRALLRAAYPSDARKGEAEGWKWIHRLPAGRADLIQIAEGSIAQRHELLRSGGTPFAVIRAERERCSMCGACGALCPTGAIGTVELEARSLLYFRFGWCTACLLCVKACPEHALGVEENIDLGILAERGRPLLEFATKECPECNDRYIPERTDQQCPVCKKLAGTLLSARGTAKRS